jgi:hypothetical protein
MVALPQPHIYVPVALEVPAENVETSNYGPTGAYLHGICLGFQSRDEMEYTSTSTVLDIASQCAAYLPANVLTFKITNT